VACRQLLSLEHVGGNRGLRDRRVGVQGRRFDPIEPVIALVARLLAEQQEQARKAEQQRRTAEQKEYDDLIKKGQGADPLDGFDTISYDCVGRTVTNYFSGNVITCSSDV
jgi:hypothetical protein